MFGLAAYPDETCFDPTRPGILPYFIDDLTESACKVNLLVSGNTTGNTAQSGQAGADPQTVANAQAACVSSSGTWNASLSVCQPSFLSQYGIYLLGAAVAAVVLIVLIKK